MLGNKHFTESETEDAQSKYMEEVEYFYADLAHKRKGAKQYADKKTKEDLFNMVSQHMQWLDKQEPNSNARLAHDAIKEAKLAEEN